MKRIINCELSKKDKNGKIQGSVNEEDEGDEEDNEVWMTGPRRLVR